jgi:four helix bundle protein
MTQDNILIDKSIDFVSKLGIALKEASETSYWLVILNKANYLDEKLYLSLKEDLDSMIRILVASLKTSKKNMA